MGRTAITCLSARSPWDSAISPFGGGGGGGGGGCGGGCCGGLESGELGCFGMSVALQRVNERSDFLLTLAY